MVLSLDPNLKPAVRVAPAKLNLTLAVVGRRTDGFHDLHSVMVPLELADRISVARAADVTGEDDSLVVEGLDCGPLRENLVLRALSAVRAAVRASLGPGHPTPGLAARLDKRIPVAAGMGGGSSDAAAALDAALEAWGVDGAMNGADVAALRRHVATGLGSDVPFFLAGGPALIEGRGEHVTALGQLAGPSPGVLVVTPAVPASTAAVFMALDDAGGPQGYARATAATSTHLATEWRAGLRADGLVARAGVLASANDLANAASVVVPGLRDLRRRLIRRLGRPVGLSGSGPTLWVLYASRAEADNAATMVREAIAEGTIVGPGSARPSVMTTAIATKEQARGSGEEGKSSV